MIRLILKACSMLVLVSNSLVIVAAEVGELNTFEAKTTAKAKDVNSNFQHLKDAVNDNNRRLTNHLSAQKCNVGQIVVGIDESGRFLCSDLGEIGARLGHSAARPAQSCKAILDNGDSIGSGAYFIDPSGTGDVFKVYCDMNTYGGGWTLCGKFDRDNSDGAMSLTDPFARAAVNRDDLVAVAKFTGPQASQDCRPLVKNGATHILSVSTSQGETWRLSYITNITDDVLNLMTTNFMNLWDTSFDSAPSEADPVGATCSSASVIDTFNIEGDQIVPDSTGTTPQGTSMFGNGAMWVNKGRNGAAYSNASTSGCTGTANDTVYWAWIDSAGKEDDHGCSSNVVGTGCSQSGTWIKPDYRYNLMFMR